MLAAFKNCNLTMFPKRFWLAGLALIAQTAGAADNMTYEQSIQNWRAQRTASLKAPDGWLSLIGLHWLQPGLNRIGSAPDNDIVLGAGPDHVGQVIVEQGKARFCTAAGVDVRVEGELVDCVPLTSDLHGEPTEVRFGSVTFYLIERDDRLALRVKDERAETRVNFTGLEYFPIDPAWRIEAEFVPYEAPRRMEFPTVLGTLETAPNPGRLVFEQGGRQFDLDVIRYQGSDEFFVIFADRTNGKQTYAPGRFLYTPLPDASGTVILDFNKAYNPPCVFTPYATCPLPPPQNRLDLAVTAGELMYGEQHGG